MTSPTEIICPRCRVSVPADKIDVPHRCPDKTCPVNEAMKRVRDHA